jgi:eukaryotic-like serine/threonine-protein kinase
MVGGKYRVERVLGTGGMALVVEATHMALGRRVAIKILQGDGARAPEVLNRFHREAQIAAQLPGDHIARVSDVGSTEDGEPYLVMELLVGRDLDAELTARGPLPIEEAVHFVLQACEGVAEAHGAGLVHRDLKPGNLFLVRRRDGSATIKVLDFGISKAAPGQGDPTLTKTTSTFGTPLYMSPEQVQSAKHVDSRSDQHAIGAILYALLTGRPPFEGESITALAVIIATQTPRPVRAVRPEVPAELEAAILRALAKVPSQRFADLAAFAAAIAPFGGADAASRVSCIASALGARTDAPRGVEPISRVAELDLRRAAPAAIGPVEDPASVDALRADQRRRSFIALTAVVTAITATIGAVVLALAGGPSPAPPDPAPSAEAGSPAETTPPSPATPADSAPPPGSAAVPAASSAASASAAPAHSVAPPPRPRAPKKAGPPSGTAKAEDVFKTRR